MPLFKLEDLEPKIDSTVYIAYNATIIGNVSIGKNSSIWFNCVIRADVDSIFIGENTNIQDFTMCHEDPGKPLKIGNGVTIGHQCVIHGCTIEDNCLIGMGAIIMNGAEIGYGSIVAAGAVVLENTKIPAFSLVTGVPGKIKTTLDKNSLEFIKGPAESYVNRARDYKSSDKFSVIK
ncbi:putative carbonic anhydrase [Candidatus Magnetomoraceae bacterium gMMP-15]